MITNLQLNNFKSFINKGIDIRPLTVLTGTNASGKSSIIQAIRMIKTGYKNNGDAWDGKSIKPFHLKSKLVKDDFFELATTIDGSNLKVKAFSITSISYDNMKGKELNSNESIIQKLNSICYIGANRLGPTNQLPAGNANTIEEVGEFGEYTIAFIDNKQYLQVPQYMRLNANSESLLDNINDWLEIIAKDAHLSYEHDTQLNVYKPFYNNILPTETGYGLSYVLPLLASLLAFFKENEILLIENPEAHLHPYAQSKLGELITRAASCGKQVIVETHSNHIVDGIRIAVKNNLLDAEKIIFHFLRRDSFEEETTIETPILNDAGKLSFWPNGFFDQSLKDKAALTRK